MLPRRHASSGFVQSPMDQVFAHIDDGFLVVAHGSAEEMAKSKAILEASNPSRVDLHENVKAQASDAVMAGMAGNRDSLVATPRPVLGK